MNDTSEPSVAELIFDQLEELIVTLVEEVRERPGVAVAIVAAVLGAVVGSIVAARASRKREFPPRKVARSARGMADTGELLGIGMKLLQNPIVRGYLFAMARRRFSK
ncbi:MAG TPA: hypothetical protein VFG86_28240 [Chloroflexota bacterium]|nr:hypothetical protein [Chloroflexota bacterium]